jgi:hypothetical protein
MEVSMLKKLLSVAVLGMAVSTSILAVGCASQSQEPYGLTGEKTTSSRPPWQDPRNLDSNGHYRPEFQHLNQRGHQ